MTGTTQLNSALNYGGVTLSNAVTGTGNMVLAASPTFTGTSNFATITSSALTSGRFALVGASGSLVDSSLFQYSTGNKAFQLTGAGSDTIVGGPNIQWNPSAGSTQAIQLGASGQLIFFTNDGTWHNAMSLSTAGSLTLNFALNYGGVTLSNSVTGTGSMVLSASPTLTGTLTAAAANFSGNINGGAGGTSTGIGALTLNGGSAAGGGALLYMYRNSVIQGYIGHTSAINGAANNNLAMYSTAAIDLLPSSGSTGFSVTSTGCGFAAGNTPNWNFLAYSTGSTKAGFQAGNSNTGAGSTVGAFFGVDTTGNTMVDYGGGFPLVFKYSGAEKMQLDTSGNLLVGTTSAAPTSPTARLTVAGNISTTWGDYFIGTTYFGGGYQLGIQAGTTARELRLETITADSSGVITFYPGAGTTEAARINSSGNLLVGSTTGPYKLFVKDTNDRTESTSQFSIQGNGYSAFHWLDATAYYIGQNSNARELRMYSGSTPTTGVKLTAGATSWASTSDEIQKDIIEPITDAASKCATLRSVIGKYKTDADDVRRPFLIAQDVEKVLPEAISTDAEGVLSLRYTEVIPLLVAAIKELTTRLAALETK